MAYRCLPMKMHRRSLLITTLCCGLPLGAISLAVAQEAKPGAMATDARLLGDAKARAAKSTSGQGAAESNEKTASEPKRIEDSYPLANDEARQKSVKILQQVTVDLLALFEDYKQMHWNLTGPLYLPLHEYYQEQSEKYRMYADVFAERILHLGYSVDGRHSTVAKTSSVPEPPVGFVTDNESLKFLVDRVTVFQKEVYQGIKDTEDSDAPTSNKLQDLAYQVDKNLWQLRVHLVKPGSLGENLPWNAQQGRDRAGESGGK